MMKIPSPPRMAKRVFLGPDNHCSGYVMVHYDRACLNPDMKAVVRIADCTSIFEINAEKFVSQSVFRDFLLKIVEVVEGKRKSVRKRIGYFRTVKVEKSEGEDCGKLRFTMIPTKEFKRKHAHLSQLDMMKLFESWYSNIVIHYDDYTCTKDEWEGKKEAISSTLREYVDFLSNLPRNRGGRKAEPVLLSQI